MARKQRTAKKPFVFFPLHVLIYCETACCTASPILSQRSIQSGCRLQRHRKFLIQNISALKMVTPKPKQFQLCKRRPKHCRTYCPCALWLAAIGLRFLHTTDLWMTVRASSVHGMSSKKKTVHYGWLRRLQFRALQLAGTERIADYWLQHGLEI